MDFLTDLRQRFFAKIAPGPDGCIDWIGAHRSSGYGLISVDNTLRSATHVSWFLKHGVWPLLKVLHTCDRPVCVNPEHLFEGTDQDNADDRMAKGRGAGKLTGLEISEIVALSDTRMGIAEIAALFDITPGWVSVLRHRRKLGDKPMSCTQIEVDGVLMSLKEAERATGVSQFTIRKRLEKGLTGAEATAPPGAAPRKVYVRRK